MIIETITGSDLALIIIVTALGLEGVIMALRAK
jgi:hypothetical protein